MLFGAVRCSLVLFGAVWCCSVLFGAVEPARPALLAGLHRALAGFGALWRAYTALFGGLVVPGIVFDQRGLIGKDLRLDNHHGLERCRPIGKDLTLKRHAF